MGFNLKQLFDAEYVYAPYIPIFRTPGNILNAFTPVKRKPSPRGKLLKTDYKAFDKFRCAMCFKVNRKKVKTDSWRNFSKLPRYMTRIANPDKWVTGTIIS